MDNATRTQKGGLLGNLFQGNFWNSRITSANVRSKELWLGYVLGPFGMMLLQSIVNSYFNQYLTDVLGFTVSRGAWIASFMVLFPLLSKIVDALTNVGMAKLLDNTTCRQGKLRPWFILSIPIVTVSVLMLFWIPFASPVAQAVWIVIAYNLFYSVGYTMWYMAYELSAALSTRNFSQRKNNSMAGQITKNIGTGIISILFPTILSAVCAMVGGSNKTGYLLCMSIMCCVAVPLTFLQYFFTRERITEERRNQYGVVGANEKDAVKIKEASFMEQFHACIKDKYWIMLIIMILLYQVLNAMKGISQVYYSGWVVNGNAYGEYAAIQAKFTMISMAPMGPGLLLLLPAFKKFGRTKVIIVGSVLAMLGSAAAFFSPGKTGAIYGGTALASIGTMTFIYSLMTFIGDSIDHVEYTQGIRVEGFTAALVGFAEMFSKGIGQALFNLGLAVTKYDTPEQIGSFVNKKGQEIALYADQTIGATNWINFSFQGSFLLMGVLFFVLFVFFFKIERNMPTVQEALAEKKRKECEAMGIEYIPQKELERREREAQKEEAEANRIKDLKEYCAKRGLDFDKENQKVLDKRAAKAAKKAKRK
nr:MFS transporter [uncultured Oscillibacter sp.]